MREKDKEWLVFVFLLIPFILPLITYGFDIENSDWLFFVLWILSLTILLALPLISIAIYFRNKEIRKKVLPILGMIISLIDFAIFSYFRLFTILAVFNVITLN